MKPTNFISNKQNPDLKIDLLNGADYGIYLENIDIKKLLPSEKINIGRAKSLSKKIKSEGIWDTPILVEQHNMVVMDGHHRLWAAHDLGLKFIPCILLGYDNKHLSLTRWDGDEPIYPKEIVSAALSGKLLEYKSTKHVFRYKLHFPLISINSLTY